MKPVIHVDRKWTKRGILCNLLLDMGAIIATVGFFYQHTPFPSTLFFLLACVISCIDTALHLPKNVAAFCVLIFVCVVTLLIGDYLPPISPLIDYLIRQPFWIFFFYHLILSIQLLGKIKPVN